MSSRLGLKEPPPGCELFRGEGLLLDLDTLEAVQQFQRNLTLVDESHGVEKVRVWKSRSKGTHAFVVLKVLPTDPYERACLQLILGSDPVREYCNMKDVRDHNKSYYDTNVLFKPLSHWQKFMAKVYDRLNIFEYHLNCQKLRVKRGWL